MASFEDILLALNPAVYLRYQETSGAACADSSPNGNDGTAQGTFTRNEASLPNVDPGIGLGGTTADYVQVPDDATLDLTSGFTYVGLMWLDSPAAPATYYALASKGNTSGGVTASFVFYLDPTLGFSIFKEAVALIAHTDAAAFPDDQQKHLVVIAFNTPTDIDVWVDGTPIVVNYDLNTSLGTNAEPLIFGRDNNAGVGSWPWIGGMDETALIPALVTQTDVDDMMAALTCVGPENDGGSGAPSVTGTPDVGETLTVDEGTWSGDATITFTYQWMRLCGTVTDVIVGETATSYEVTDDDIGCDVFCEVTGTNDCSASSADSNSLGPVAQPPPVNITPPVVSGVALPGHSLVTTDGTWSGGVDTFTYQWEINCGSMWEELAGETSDTLLLTDEMIDCLVRCVVTATNDEGSAEQASNSVMVTDNIPAAVEICEGPLWRFVVTTLQMEILTFLDRLARSRTVTYVLNQPSVATGTVPSDDPRINIPHTDGDPYLAEGNRLLLGFRLEPVSPGVSQWMIRYGGIILQVEDSGQSDNADTQYTAYDPWQYLRNRPVRNGPDFDYTLPGADGSSYTETRIDVIAGQLLRNTIVEDGFCYIDAGLDYGGTGYWGGTIEECDQIDINFQQGTNVGDAWDQLVSGDQADIILTPIYDPVRRPGYTHELSIFVQAGAYKDSQIFGWDKFPRNVVGISNLEEGSGRANEMKGYAGLGGSAPGGRLVPIQSDATSIAKYGVYFASQFFPGQNVPAAVEALMAAAVEIRKNGRKTVTVTPSPDCANDVLQGYGLGDRVPVYASDALRDELIGYQRIYGIPISIADDSTESVERMLASKQGVSE